MAATSNKPVNAEEKTAPKRKEVASKIDKDAPLPEVSHVPAKDLTGTGLEAVTENPVDALESENVLEVQKQGKEATDRAVKEAEGDVLRAVDADPPVDVTPRPDLGDFEQGVNGCLQAVYVYLTANDIFSRQQALAELHTAMKGAGVRIPTPEPVTEA